MRLLRFLRSSASIGKDIDFYSRFSPSPLSMKQFLDFGKSCCRSRWDKNGKKVIHRGLNFFFSSNKTVMLLYSHSYSVILT